MAAGALIWLATAAMRELALFAAVGFLLGGIDDLLIDAIWLARTAWRRLTVYRRHARADAGTLRSPERSGPIALFIPAWDESAVIGAMLRTTLARFAGEDCRLYVGAYPNDPATIRAIAAVAARDRRVRPVLCTRDGPTTKADCLNHLWHALVQDEEASGPVKAVVLHDAEDVVHSAELRLFDRLIERFDLVQLPVLPLIDRASWRARLISGHYVDEFAEAHGKQLVVREALGAALPSAGVGCAIARGALGRIAADQQGRPFDPTSLTEDYEIGFKIAAQGGRSAFVRLPGRGARGMVAVREHFPATLNAAVRQKARWMNGIALAGWDRIGWQGGLADRWMLLRDRRAVLAALVLAAAYAALLLWGLLSALAWLGGAPLPGTGVATPLLHLNLALLGWRLAMRIGFVAGPHGWRAALLAPVRMIVANIIEMMAAVRALGGYFRGRRDGSVQWDKTAHHFPELVPGE